MRKEMLIEICGLSRVLSINITPMSLELLVEECELAFRNKLLYRDLIHGRIPNQNQSFFEVMVV